MQKFRQPFQRLRIPKAAPLAALRKARNSFSVKADFWGVNCRAAARGVLFARKKASLASVPDAACGEGCHAARGGGLGLPPAAAGWAAAGTGFCHAARGGVYRDLRAKSRRYAAVALRNARCGSQSCSGEQRLPLHGPPPSKASCAKLRCTDCIVYPKLEIKGMVDFWRKMGYNG